MIILFLSLSIVFLIQLLDKSLLVVRKMFDTESKPTLVLGIFISSLVIILIPVLIGYLLNKFVPKASLVLASGLIFLMVGLFMIFEKDEEIKERFSKLPSLFRVITNLVGSELGEKTQILVIGVILNSKETFFTFVGATIGFLIPNLLVLFLRRQLLEERIKMVLKYIVSFILIALGIIVLLEYSGAFVF
ncbi:MAG: TMEM165/GDT1 family protein [Brevinematales bacterium]|nr:TMEM165/GDT1 family protein [Brevinematales bacterium]